MKSAVKVSERVDRLLEHVHTSLRPCLLSVSLFAMRFPESEYVVADSFSILISEGKGVVLRKKKTSAEKMQKTACARLQLAEQVDDGGIAVEARVLRRPRLCRAAALFRNLACIACIFSIHVVTLCSYMYYL